MIDGRPDIFDRYADLELERDFWKQCAEHAVNGWIAQEDVSITLREKLAAACSIGLHISVDATWSDECKRTAARLERMREEALADDDSPEET